MWLEWQWHYRIRIACAGEVLDFSGYPSAPVEQELPRGSVLFASQV